MINNNSALAESQCLAPKFKFAVNTCGSNKDWDFKKLAANFRDVEGTIEDVQQHIKAGHAVCAGLLDGKWRSKANVIGSQWIPLDIDNSDVARDAEGKPIKDANGNSIKVYDPQLTIEEALAHPFIQKHCALLYTTASHKPDWHKFRLIFLLPQYVEGADTVEACTRSLMQQLPHDPACKDASRVFYGNTEAEFLIVNPEATLPSEWVSEAIAIALQEREEYQQRIQEIESRRQQWREISDVEGWDTEQLIQSALSFIPPRSPGSGNYDECRQVLMALVNHYGPTDAEIIAEKWSPSIPGTTWNIRAKIRSFRRGGISIGTLFHIAKQYGFRFPQRQYEPYQRNKGLISREQWELGQVREDLTSFKNLLKQAIAPFVSEKKGFSKPPQPKPEPEITAPVRQLIVYKRGNIPHRNQVTGDISITCKPEEHIAAWVEAISKGWKEILDNSHPGLGKSHNAGQLTAALFGIEKLIYQDANHRNPSTLPIEANFVDLPVRHNGLKIDPTRTTPMGDPFQLRPKAGEIPDTIGNCHRSYLFEGFRDKNFVSLDFEESSVSPICNGCPLQNQCRFAHGLGFGFRYLKRSTIQNFSQIRAHPDSTPVTLTNAAGIPFTVGRIWEEAGTLIKPVREIQLRLKDFDTTAAQLATGLPPEQWAKLQPVLQFLRSLLTQDIKPDSRYGFDDAALRTFLPEFPQDLDVEGIQQIVEPNLEFLSDLDSLDIQADQQLSKSAAARFAAKRVVKDSAKKAGKDFLELPLYWLPDFLEAWKGEGFLACKWGVVSIYRPNTKHQDLTNSAQFNIYLDATTTPEQLKLKLNYHEPVLIIEQSRPDYSNLKVVNVTGLGKLSKNRSPLLTARVNALKETLLKLHKRLGIIEWKSLAQEAIDRIEYGHFVDGRGVNRFSDADAIASFGIPYQNIGTLAAHFQVMTGFKVNLEDKDSIFQQYLIELVQAEIIQEIGRLRAHRRPGEKLTFYFCADYDLSFLLTELPGVKLEVVDASELCTEAGSRDQQTGHAIVKAFTQLWESQQKIGQTAIAKIIDTTQGWVSRFTQRWGGWARFKKLLLLLLDSLHSSSNKNFTDLSDEERWFAREYFPTLIDEAESSPEDALTHIAEVATVLTVTQLRRIVDFSTPQVKADLLMIILRCLPTEVYSGFAPVQAHCNPTVT
ncbi:MULTISPECIES: PriCT-2 domain-containing protein [Nostoc]|uniref:PriCT-2 domain-containing protein n=1 Tax=Nostoc paludosum FACHB-159 TaxID=2692908 RepID=A0ABR8KH68_9NOSO|nr:MULTISPECIES: PriCT-2 domain-containing protein [Nostoc]MBD2682559.1 PriCT-2 domain-containing protein [Nostoc sp. FACHB-857]MBD2738891.1 PriCT-2 domain-containing protein [Nostoc paludosum FACHB-159]